MTSDRLESWKEIAAYLKRDLTTVQRWEKREGLPVRRHLHHRLGTVYAYKSELDAWWNNRRPRLEKEQEAQVAWWRRRPLRVAGTLLALLALLVGFNVGGWRDRLLSGTSPPRIVSLAVLPLENLSGNPEQEYFCDGMTDALTTNLAKISALRVVSRTSVMRYKGSNKPLHEIAGELEVDAVVEGTVLRFGQRVRVTAQLIHVPSDRHLWAESYERDLRDILTLQGEVAQAIAQQIHVRLTPQEQSHLASARSVHPEAYEAYLKGRYFWNKRTEEGYTRAIEYFEKAIRGDPGYAAAYAGLADAYVLLGSLTTNALPRSEAMARARKAAQSALALDESLAEAHTSLAFVRMQYDWDWEAAEKSFLRAIELKPDYATARHWYAYYLIAMGRGEEAIREMRRALELDPLSLIISTDLGEMLYYSRAYDAALEQTRKTLEMDPGFPLAHRLAGWVYLAKGMPREAVAELRRAVSADRNSSLASLGCALALSGQRREAHEILRELKRRARYEANAASDLAQLYGALGDLDEAFRWLERCYQVRCGSMILLNADGRAPFFFDPISSDPRFHEVLSRIGLSGEQLDLGN